MALVYTGVVFVFIYWISILYIYIQRHKIDRILKRGKGFTFNLFSIGSEFKVLSALYTTNTKLLPPPYKLAFFLGRISPIIAFLAIIIGISGVEQVSQLS